MSAFKGCGPLSAFFKEAFQRERKTTSLETLECWNCACGNSFPSWVIWQWTWQWNVPTKACSSTRGSAARPPPASSWRSRSTPSSSSAAWSLLRKDWLETPSMPELNKGPRWVRVWEQLLFGFLVVVLLNFPCVNIILADAVPAEVPRGE